MPASCVYPTWTGCMRHDSMLEAELTPATAWIVEGETPPDHLAGGVQAGNRLAFRIDHLRVTVDLGAAERESDSASHAVGLEGRLIDRIRPVRLRNGQALRAARP